jgi:hypothetical protein
MSMDITVATVVTNLQRAVAIAVESIEKAIFGGKT